MSSKKFMESLEDRERLEFEELNKWLRVLTNVLWTVPSVLLTITFITINYAIESLLKHTCIGIFVSLIFIIGWLLTTIFVYRIITITYDVSKRLRKLNNYWVPYLQALSNPDIINKNNNAKKFNAINTPYGKLVIPLSILLTAGWFVFFCVLISKLI